MTKDELKQKLEELGYELETREVLGVWTAHLGLGALRGAGFGRNEEEAIAHAGRIFIRSLQDTIWEVEKVKPLLREFYRGGR